MARISDLRLEVGRASGSVEFARIRGRVSWTGREVGENYWYRLAAALVERDDERDFFDMLPDGNIHWYSVGNLDDWIGWIGSTWMRPAGQASRTFDLRRNWDFGNQESGNEEYLGVATVVPEMRSDIRFSNEVSINLG
jgi:hypothetical protein